MGLLIVQPEPSQTPPNPWRLARAYGSVRGKRAALERQVHEREQQLREEPLHPLIQHQQRLTRLVHTLEQQLHIQEQQLREQRQQEQEHSSYQQQLGAYHEELRSLNQRERALRKSYEEAKLHHAKRVVKIKDTNPYTAKIQEDLTSALEELEKVTTYAHSRRFRLFALFRLTDRASLERKAEALRKKITKLDKQYSTVQQSIAQQQEIYRTNIAQRELAAYEHQLSALHTRKQELAEEIKEIGATLSEKLYTPQTPNTKLHRMLSTAEEKLAQVTRDVQRSSLRASYEQAQDTIRTARTSLYTTIQLEGAVDNALSHFPHLRPTGQQQPPVRSYTA